MTTMAIIIAAVQLLGLVFAVFALLSTRTSQGTVAWVVTLIAFPWLGIPAYLLFGRTRFNGYVTARVAHEIDFRKKLGLEYGKLRCFMSPHPQTERHDQLKTFEVLAKLPFTEGNNARLLINGRATFDDIFDGIRQAKNYVLIQFYIVNEGLIGDAFWECLVEARARGVRVYFLYDEIGSYELADWYLEGLRENGVQVYSFHSHRNVLNRFQLNFRNHRKIVVVDGFTTWIGGHNIGDEYINKDPKYPFWRDTHIRLDGPAALGAQLSFVEDWYWVTEETLQLNWKPVETCYTNQRALVLPSGPSDTFETASLMMQYAMHVAKKRIWIASPYFVPDEGVLQSLRLAALRGVDVRILIPEKPDNLLIYLSAFSFVSGILKAGVKIMRYQRGFLHQKVFLVDDYLAAVGTTNMDNRSFRLNFEVTVLLDNHQFATEVEAMLLDDFSHAQEMTIKDAESKPLWFKILCRAAYLSAPVQ